MAATDKDVFPTIKTQLALLIPLKLHSLFFYTHPDCREENPRDCLFAAMKTITVVIARLGRRLSISASTEPNSLRRPGRCLYLIYLDETCFPKHLPAESPRRRKVAELTRPLPKLVWNRFLTLSSSLPCCGF